MDERIEGHLVVSSVLLPPRIQCPNRLTRRLTPVLFAIIPATVMIVGTFGHHNDDGNDGC